MKLGIKCLFSNLVQQLVYNFIMIWVIRLYFNIHIISILVQFSNFAEKSSTVSWSNKTTGTWQFINAKTSIQSMIKKLSMCKKCLTIDLMEFFIDIVWSNLVEIRLLILKKSVSPSYEIKCQVHVLGVIKPHVQVCNLISIII